MNASTRHAPQPATTSVWIADPRRADYHGLARIARSGYLDVSYLDSAHDVLRRWATARPDVCLVNVRLPGLNGFDLVEMLRPFPQGTAVGIVADTYSAEAEVHALTLGVHYFLCKPLDSEVLAECCRRHREADAERRAARPTSAERRCLD